jgi:hypothetical protein
VKVFIALMVYTQWTRPGWVGAVFASFGLVAEVLAGFRKARAGILDLPLSPPNIVFLPP